MVDMPLNPTKSKLPLDIDMTPNNLMLRFQ